MFNDQGEYWVIAKIDSEKILALATPIYFQTVIDKVIVHNGTSNLNVLAISFIVVTFVYFTLNLLRAYVQNNTAN